MVGTTIRSNWRMGGVATVLKEVDGMDLETAAEADVDGNVERIVVEGGGGKPPWDRQGWLSCSSQDNAYPWKAA